MDKFKSRKKYLSYRIMLFVRILIVLQIWLLLVGGVLCYMGRMPVWLLGLGFLLTVLLDVFFYKWIVKPYQWMEQRICLLAECHSDSVLAKEWEIFPSPSTRELCRKILVMMNSPDRKSVV